MDWIKVLLNGLFAGFITFSTALVSHITDMEPGSEITDISSITWLVVGLGAFSAAIMSWRTYTANPPRSNNNASL